MRSVRPLIVLLIGFLVTSSAVAYFLLPKVRHWSFTRQLETQALNCGDVDATFNIVRLITASDSDRSWTFWDRSGKRRIDTEEAEHHPMAVGKITVTFRYTGRDVLLEHVDHRVVEELLRIPPALRIPETAK